MNTTVSQLKRGMNIMTKMIFITLFFLSANTIAAPTLLFSDIESGPKSGWSTAEPDKGAAISIWGYGFGQSKGQSYVSVNGVDL